MKLEQAINCGKTSDPIEEVKFGIGNPALLLGYLRDGMYKNPVMALTREYACNARDAHREVGKADRPIEIILPTEWDYTWVCRDYGPGISPDRMKTIFTQFGNSSKRDSNLPLR